MNVLLTLILAIFLIPTSIVSAQSSNFSIPSPNGNLVGIINTPDNRSEFPLVILSHGFTSSKESDVIVAVDKELQKLGIATIRFDFDGHGESDGDFQFMTVPKEIEDLKAVYEYATTVEGVTSISLVGHSQGGVVTSMVAGDLGKKKIKSVVLMAPAAILREDAIRGNTQGAIYDPLDPPEYVELEKPGEILKLGRDYIRTAFDLPIYETAEGYRGDVCIIHGTGDRIVPYTVALHYQHIYRNPELHLIPREDHGFSNDREGAAKIAAEFLARHLK